MSRQATKPFYTMMGVSLCFCQSSSGSLSRKISLSLSKKLIFEHKGTYFLAKNTLLLYKSLFCSVFFSLFRENRFFDKDVMWQRNPFLVLSSAQTNQSGDSLASVSCNMLKEVCSRIKTKKMFFLFVFCSLNCTFALCYEF